MNKVITTSYLLIVLSIGVFAQTNDDYHKFEFYGGYSNSQVAAGRINSNGSFSRIHEGSNGFEVSGVGSINRYFGIKGDFSVAFSRQTFTGSLNSGGVITTFPIQQNRQLYNFLGGVQIKDSAKKSRIKPFAHALVGVGYDRYNDRNNCQSGTNCGNLIPSKGSSSGFAGALGGGLDIKISRKIDLRAIQLDYNPYHPDTNTQNNFRFGFGIVFH